jgi:uncharacterized protein (DUF169 family)
MLNIREKTRRLLELLGHDEAPLGVFYSDEKPDGYGPKPGEIFSRERETAGEIDWQKAFVNFSCLFGNIWLARKKKKAAWISHGECGCMGGGYYSGVYGPYLDMNVMFVSTGVPGTHIEGEHFMPSPESMRAFMDACALPLGNGKYCVIKPLEQFFGMERPLVVVFFARPEVLTGLNSLAIYTVGHHDAVIAPFGANCTNIIAWPLVYERRGLERAVLGGLDPTSRKFMKTDEMSFAVPLALYCKMLDNMETSTLTRHTWEGVRKKVTRSIRAWNAGKED